jgi:hypothetical protein
MRSDPGVRGRTRQAAGLLLVWMLGGTCVLPAAQQGNSVAIGEAAAVGQRVPGRAGGRGLPRADEIGRHAVQDPVQAQLQREARKQRFEKMKEQAGELAEMANSLKEDLEKSNPNILSVGVTEKAKKIQKLAGKIRSESRF